MTQYCGTRCASVLSTERLFNKHHRLRLPLTLALLYHWHSSVPLATEHFPSLQQARGTVTAYRRKWRSCEPFILNSNSKPVCFLYHFSVKWLKCFGIIHLKSHARVYIYRVQMERSLTIQYRWKRFSIVCFRRCAICLRGIETYLSRSWLVARSQR